MNNGSHSRAGSIPLHRVALLRPFTEFLTDVGTPIERGFRQAGLPVCALEDINNYIPSQRFYEFLVSMARSQGIENLGFHVGQRAGANGVDPKLKNLLRSSPTLYQGLLKTSELSNRTVTNCHVGILQPPHCESVHFYHRPSCDARNPVIHQIGWFGLTLYLGMIREFTGPQWQPTEIGIMTDHALSREIREQFPHTRIRLSQKHSYIALENALLSLPPLTPQTAKPELSPLHYESLSHEFTGSLKQVLQTYAQESDLNIDFAAELCNTSKRSLQRHLTESGTQYSRLLDEVRFHTARRMLLDPNMKVVDIANRLGYSEPTNFTRSFRRIAGVSPRVYRQHHTRQNRHPAPQGIRS